MRTNWSRLRDRWTTIVSSAKSIWRRSSWWREKSICNKLPDISHLGEWRIKKFKLRKSNFHFSSTISASKSVSRHSWRRMKDSRTRLFSCIPKRVMRNYPNRYSYSLRYSWIWRKTIRRLSKAAKNSMKKGESLKIIKAEWQKQPKSLNCHQIIKLLGKKKKLKNNKKICLNKFLISKETDIFFDAIKK